MTKRKSFILYQDYEEQLNLLSDQDAGILLKAIFRYENGEKIDLCGPVGMAFDLIKSSLKGGER